MTEHISMEQFRALPSRDSKSTLRQVAEDAIAARPAALVGREGEKTGQSKGRNKYGAKKVVTGDGVFDSQMEYRRWCDLKLMQAAGQIQHLERQIPYSLEVNGLKICRFTIDHKWFDVTADCWVYEDVKGVLVRDFTLRVKLIKAIHGIDVQVWPKRKRKVRRAI